MIRLDRKMLLAAVILAFVGTEAILSRDAWAQNGIVFPLKVSVDGRQLVDQNNTPFLINGDAGWSLMVGLTDQEVETYLENRRLKGFNTILVNLIEHYFGGPANAYGEQPFTTPGDFSTPNEDYFAHVDAVIQKALEKKMLLLLTPAYLGFNCGDQGWCGELKANGVTKCRNYGRYLGNRYKNYPNIIWVHGGDAPAGNAIDNVQAIVEGIAEVDSVHLHTAHCNRYSSALDCYDYSWLDINNTYSDCSVTAAQISDDYNRSRIVPFFYIEGRYENENASQVCLRSQAYWSILGGAIGHVFGNSPIWSFDRGWEQELDSPGSRSTGFVAALFKSRAWNMLIPDSNHEVVVNGFGQLNNSNYASAARTSDGNTAIVYIPTSRQITVDLTKISGSNVKAWWYNPATGEPTLIGIVQKNAAMNFTPSGNNDWLLVLDNADLDLPPPGTANYPLPVDYLVFTAMASGNSVEISWKTASETNNYGFEVERQFKNQSFEKIGFVKANGNSGVNHYSFIDKDLAPGKYSYRLKQLDADGSVNFSAAVEVLVALPMDFQLYQNHPNPFNPHTTINYSLPRSGFVELVVFNIRGETVDSLVYEPQEAGYHSVLFDAGALPSGVYFYRLTSYSFSEIRKMVLLR